jgi:adenine-specific DNA methylase
MLQVSIVDQFKQGKLSNLYKRGKTAIRRSIVATIRKQKGQFSQRGNDKIWYDIGDAKATEKTSQALREGQPDLRGKK